MTNIRGFDDVDRVIEQFPDDDFSLDAKIIWVDTTTQAGRTKMAKWFHWVPFGAMIIIDEVQQVYPDRRDFKLESLDKYTPEPGEIIEDIGLPEGRPEDVFTAYDKQRHYNWDIFCSTPNIAKVKKEIREVSEWAYRHRDISGLLPWKKNTWIEHQHDPESSGKAATHRVGSPTQYKADIRVFKCYASTATGEHVKSKAGRSIFQDRKLLGLAVLILVCLGVIVFMFNKRFGAKKSPEASITAPEKNNPSRDNITLDSSTHVVPAARSPALVDSVEPIKQLTAQMVRQWSVFGVNEADLLKIPDYCNVTSSSVRCTFQTDENYNAVIRQALNRVCFPFLSQIRCELIFFVQRPEIKNEDKNTVLAKSLPF